MMIYNLKGHKFSMTAMSMVAGSVDQKPKLTLWFAFLTASADRGELGPVTRSQVDTCSGGALAESRSLQGVEHRAALRPGRAAGLLVTAELLASPGLFMKPGLAVPRDMLTHILSSIDGAGNHLSLWSGG